MSQPPRVLPPVMSVVPSAGVVGSVTSAGHEGNTAVTQPTLSSIPANDATQLAGPAQQMVTPIYYAVGGIQSGVLGQPMATPLPLSGYITLQPSQSKQVPLQPVQTVNSHRQTFPTLTVPHLTEPTVQRLQTQENVPLAKDKAERTSYTNSTASTHIVQNLPSTEAETAAHIRQALAFTQFAATNTVLPASPVSQAGTSYQVIGAVSNPMAVQSSDSMYMTQHIPVPNKSMPSASSQIAREKLHIPSHVEVTYEHIPSQSASNAELDKSNENIVTMTSVSTGQVYVQLGEPHNITDTEGPAVKTQELAFSKTTNVSLAKQTHGHCKMQKASGYMELGNCSSAFRTFFHRQQGSRPLHHFIAELLDLESYLPPESTFDNDDGNFWRLEYYDPEYDQVLEKLTEYTKRNRMASPASALEQLLTLYLKRHRHEAQFRKPTDVSDFTCMTKPDTCTVATQTSEVITHPGLQGDNVELVENTPESSARKVTKKRKSRSRQPKKLLPSSDCKSNTGSDGAKTDSLQSANKNETGETKTLSTANTACELAVTEDNHTKPLPARKGQKRPRKTILGRTSRKKAKMSDGDLDKSTEESPKEATVESSLILGRSDEPDSVPNTLDGNARENDGDNTRYDSIANIQPKDRETFTEYETNEKTNQANEEAELPTEVEKCNVQIQTGELACFGDVYINKYSKKKTRRHKEQQAQHLCCMVCGTEFLDIEDYTIHMMAHPHKARYYCEPCNAMFTDRDHYVQHGTKHYGNTDYKCSHCQWQFATMLKLKEHFAKLVAIVKCPLCELYLTKFTLNSHLTSHIRGNFTVLQKLHGMRPEMLFVHETLLKQQDGKNTSGNVEDKDSDEDNGEPHKKQEKNGKKGDKGVMDKERPLRGWMIKDIIGAEIAPNELYEDLKGDVIPLTKFEGQTVFHQGKVINFYTQKSKIPCVTGECDLAELQKSFSSRPLYLPPNIRAVVCQGVLKFYNRERFNCHVCYQTFSKKIYLKDHIKFVHLNEREHQCKECFKTFTHATDLSHHMKRVHGNPSTHKCSMCDKVFPDPYSLQTHQKTHSCGKVECHICHKPFNRKYLREHINFVHNQVKMKCNYCGKAFASATAKRRCERMHLGKKNYLCADCGKAYFAISDLIQHRKRYHEEPKQPVPEVMLDTGPTDAEASMAGILQ